uniref:C-type lectin domain-containing protein n=2 Tax=Nothobranchius TaxID=28779 RepID=A0A1A8NTZ4_9TELE
MNSGVLVALLVSLSCGLWSGAEGYHRAHHWCPSGWSLFHSRCVKFYHPGDCRCPSGWTNHGNRCFLFVNIEQTWDSAENYCRAFGGHLASFHSYRGLSFLRTLVYRGSGSFKNTWVGGTDRFQNRVWRWTDGSDYNYSHWYRGEPNNSGGREECMEINFRGSDGNNDEKCYARRPFICARHC